jgi:hypothetical protein
MSQLELFLTGLCGLTDDLADPRFLGKLPGAGGFGTDICGLALDDGRVCPHSEQKGAAPSTRKAPQ